MLTHSAVFPPHPPAGVLRRGCAGFLVVGILLGFAAGGSWAGEPGGPTEAGSPDLEAHDFPTPPTIDGRLDDWPEWDGPDTARLDRPDQIIENPGRPWSGPEDLSALLRLGSDATSLFVALKIRDPDAFHPGRPWWHGDGVELFLDLDRQDGSPPAERYGPGCRQIFLMPRSPEFRWGVAFHGGEAVFGADGLRGVKVASVETGDGYTVEARLPWKDLGLRGTEAVRIGFALALNDNDGDGTPDGRCTYMSLNGKGDLYRNPSNFTSLRVPARVPAAEAPSPDGTGVGLGVMLLVTLLGVLGVFLLAGPGSRFLARLGPLPKGVALALTGLVALVVTLDAVQTRRKAEGEVRAHLEGLAEEADVIARAAAGAGAMPLDDRARRDRVLATLLGGGLVPSALPADTAAFVEIQGAGSLEGRRVPPPPGAPAPPVHAFLLDRTRRFEIARPVAADTFVLDLGVRPILVQDPRPHETVLPLADVVLETDRETRIAWIPTVDRPREGPVRLAAPIEEPTTVTAFTWTPRPRGPRVVLRGASAGDRALFLAQETDAGVPAVGGPGGMGDAGRVLPPDEALSFELPYLLGADRLWLIFHSPEAFPLRLGSEVAAGVTLTYDQGDAQVVELRNGEHLTAEQMPAGIRRPEDMVSRIAWRWTEKGGAVRTREAVPIPLDPTRRARRLEIENVGGAGPLHLLAATVVRSSRLPTDSPLGLAPGSSQGADSVFVRAPSPDFAAPSAWGRDDMVRLDRRVGTEDRSASVRLAAPLPRRVRDRESRARTLLLVCLAFAVLVLVFLAADAVEHFHRLTLRLAFAVLVAALVPLATAVFLVDRTTAARLEAEVATRAQVGIGSASAGLLDALDRAQEAADHLARHLARGSAQDEESPAEIGRLVRLYRAGAFPDAGAQHALVTRTGGLSLEIPGSDEAHSLAGPRFFVERAGSSGLHISPWDGVLLVASARRGPADRAVSVSLGVRVDDAFLAEVVQPGLPEPTAVAALLDADGTPLASTGPDSTSFLAALTRRSKEIGDRLDTERDAVLPVVPAGPGGPRLAIVTALAGEVSGDAPAWLALGIDRGGLTRTLGEQREQLAWLSLFGVLLIVGVAALTARRVADPVKGLVHVTEAVRRGAFDVQVPTPGADEVGDLARAFDQMRLDLKHRVADLDFLRRAQGALAGSLDYTHRAATVLDLFREAVAPDAALVLDATTGAGPLSVAAEAGRKTAFTDRTFRPAPGGWIEAALNSPDAIGIEAPGQDPRVAAEGGLGTRLVEDRPVWIAIPLRVADEPVGVVVLAWDDPEAYPRGEERRLLSPLAGTCALALHNARLYRLAALDDVTRLPGATAFEAALRAEVEAAAAGGTPITLLRIGLDHLDHVTRRRGVEIARDLLAAVGQTLRRVGGDLQRIGRLRDDELAMRLPSVSREEAMRLAEEIREKLSRVEVVPEEGGEPVGTSVTVGLARAPDDATSLEFLLDAAERALANARREGGGRVEDASRLDAGLVDLPPFEEGAIFRSEKMVRVVEAARRAARTDASVLITGETGTGKEVIANLIHRRSRRAEKPFVGVNCAAFPESLLESELFGHERGAFTGAERRREGRFELADDGSLFLDEIADMAPSAQVKLLRVLQEKQFNRLGGTRPVRVDVRIIAATNRELEQAVSDGSFRKDLYYRLNVIRLELPPLRERREEIPLFVDRFLGDAVRRTGRGPRKLTAAAMDVLYRHPWPGNVRELKNAIERAMVLCDEDIVGPEHLHLDGGTTGSAVPPRAAPLDEINERQRRLLDHLSRHGRCTNREYQDLTGTSPRTGLRDLKDLMDRGLLVRDGKRRGAVYRLP